MTVQDILLLDPESNINISVASLQQILTKLSKLKIDYDWSSTCAHILKSELESLKQAHAELKDELNNALSNWPRVDAIDINLDDL